MRHLKGFRTLNRTHSHRKALYKNMVTSLLKHERIKTTKIKAKEIRRVAEKIITKAKVKSLHNIRVIGRLITDKDILMKLFNEIGPRYSQRNGGYTRIIKLAKRKGDGADTAYIELIGEAGSTIQKKKKKTTAKADVKPETKEEAKTKESEDKPKVKEEVKTEAKAPKVKEETKKEPKKEAKPKKTEDKGDAKNKK